MLGPSLRTGIASSRTGQMEDPGGGGGSLLGQQALARAQALLGAGAVTKAFGTQFDVDTYVAKTINAPGTAALSQAHTDSMILSSVGAGGLGLVRPSGLASHVINVQSQLWYIEWNAAFLTAIAATSYCALSFRCVSGASNLFIGALGNRSTVNFSYDFYNNAGAATVNGSLGVAIDTNKHLWQLYGNTTNFVVRIDEIDRLTVAIPAATSSPGSWAAEASDSAAGNRQVLVDDAHICI